MVLIEVLNLTNNKRYIKSLNVTKASACIISENVLSKYEFTKDLSFLVNPGEHVAFVGPTGSGKTTIIRLLCRLYEPQSGEIFIDEKLSIHFASEL